MQTYLTPYHTHFEVFSFYEEEIDLEFFHFYSVIEHWKDHRFLIGSTCRSLREDTAIGICSHEAIEKCLAEFMVIDQQRPDLVNENTEYMIHSLIGSTFSKINRLSIEDYVGNVDGLPHLPEDKWRNTGKESFQMPHTFLSFLYSKIILRK